MSKAFFRTKLPEKVQNKEWQTGITSSMTDNIHKQDVFVNKFALILLLYIPVAFTQPLSDERNSPGLQQISNDTDRFPMVELGTYSYQVPVPDMGEYSYYVFTFLGDTRVMNSSGHPDQFGVINEQVSVPMNMLEEVQDQRPFSHLLLAYNRYTGKRTYYMDIQDVSLRMFLGTIMHTMIYASNYQARPSIEYEHESAKDLIVTVKGYRMSPKEVYDLIREQTGCIIDEIGNRVLIISACS